MLHLSIGADSFVGYLFAIVEQLYLALACDISFQDSLGEHIKHGLLNEPL